MKDILLLGSLEMSDMTKIRGLVSVVIAGGHLARPKLVQMKKAAARRTMWEGASILFQHAQQCIRKCYDLTQKFGRRPHS